MHKPALRLLAGRGKEDFSSLLPHSYLSSGQRRLREEAGFKQGAEGRHLPDPRRYRFLAVVCACLYFGCAGYDPYRAPWDNLFWPGRTYYSSSRYSSSRERHRRGEHRRVARNRPAGGEPTTTSATESVPTDTDRVTPVSTAASSPRASLSMAGDSGDRAHAQHLLAAVDTKLSRARAHGLKGSQKETYERASQLAHRARRALADDDCAAASSLATKASSLAAGISEP